MERNLLQEERITLYFRVSVFLKGLISLVEIIGGIVVLFIPVSYLTDIIVRLAQAELVEDPGDFISVHLIQLAQQLSFSSGTFVALYLISRGAIKLLLVVALLKNQLWAYPSSMALLGLFVLYQLYQIEVTFSAPLLVLTIFDLFVTYFIWREYKVLKTRS